ncbi:replication initiation protein [Pleomorphomonas carboxyditropha]|uniref:Initiator Rep protein WH1 domain-containing protein n=1 Tax=Pleomorphomonas carboxyditropha TaxID=2023338 RepID=A0A2G9X113_9HYPH|nr:replication initiation protein [Pleomorphomonas carboxyditropha]PIP00658.1 hypothetical protein CJ014_00715 [Pleomorphomonas carboxyditropha]
MTRSTQSSSTRATNDTRSSNVYVRSRSLDTLAQRQRRYKLRVHAASLPKALSDDAEMAAQSPTTPVQRLILQRMRVEPPDNLTAQDQALWHLMITQHRDDEAHGRELDDDAHKLPFDIAMRYLNISDDRRLVDSVKRLARTMISFDVDTDYFKRLGVMPIVLCYVEINRRTGQKYVRFQIPAKLRDILGSYADYSYVELAAWPRFRSKFAGRLYSLLASYRPINVSGGDVTIDVPVDELADVLGSSDGYGQLKRRTLIPAIEGIAEASRRLSITEWSEVRGKGRGAPIAAVRFAVHYDPLLEPEINPGIPERDNCKRELAAIAIHAMHDIDPIHPNYRFPTAPDLGRIARMQAEIYGKKRINLAVMSLLWKFALDEAYCGATLSNAKDPSVEHIYGSALQNLIETRGARVAFAAWSRAEIEQPRLMLAYATRRTWGESQRQSSIEQLKRNEIVDGYKPTPQQIGDAAVLSDDVDWSQLYDDDNADGNPDGYVYNPDDEIECETDHAL